MEGGNDRAVKRDRKKLNAASGQNLCVAGETGRSALKGLKDRSVPFAQMSATYDSNYTGSQLHADVDAGKVSGFYGGSYISY